MTKRIIRNKRICYILIAAGAFAVFFSSTIAATGTLIRNFFWLGLLGAALLIIGIAWLRGIELRELDEEQAAARRRSFRLQNTQEDYNDVKRSV